MHTTKPQYFPIGVYAAAEMLISINTILERKRQTQVTAARSSNYAVNRQNSALSQTLSSCLLVRLLCLRFLLFVAAAAAAAAVHVQAHKTMAE